MKTSFDTNTILWKILNDGKKAGRINNDGGIYKSPDDRPDGSNKEDIVINTIELSQEYLPQIGTSNVNIHVSDKDVKIGGQPQKKAHSERLEAIAKAVLSEIRNANIEGLKAIAESMGNPLKDTEPVPQHYVNIRISWVIHE